MDTGHDRGDNGDDPGRVAQIINNTKFGKINNLLSIGHDMECVAGQALL